jgi:hypothetical protein
MKKMIWISVEKENESFLGGMYPQDRVENALKYFVENGYKIVGVR